MSNNLTASFVSHNIACDLKCMWVVFNYLGICDLLVAVGLLALIKIFCIIFNCNLKIYIEWYIFVINILSVLCVFSVVTWHFFSALLYVPRVGKKSGWTRVGKENLVSKHSVLRRQRNEHNLLSKLRLNLQWLHVIGWNLS